MIETISLPDKGRISLPALKKPVYMSGQDPAIAWIKLNLNIVVSSHYMEKFILKYIFLAGKIIRTARSVIMKLSEKYPYREMYEQSFA